MAHRGRFNAVSAVIAALSTGATHEEAAGHGKVSERTIRRWLTKPAFKRRLNAARAQLLESTIGKLSGKMMRAVETLEALLDAESETVRLGAARSIIELGAKLRDSREIEERLQDVEKRQQDWDASQKGN
jgi:hypothetical protein